MFAKKSEGYNQGHISAVCLGKGITIKDTSGFIYPITNHIPVFQRSNYLIIKILQTIFGINNATSLLKDLLPNNTNP